MVMSTKVEGNSAAGSSCSAVTSKPLELEGDAHPTSIAAWPLCPDIYSKSCKCKKGNPNCLTGLIPGPTGFRRKGLWQKDTRSLVQDGRDPAEDKRQDSATPAGLNNLGNTCYVNGALQCLFMTPAFRRGLYAVEPPAADDEVVSHIRRLFAAMQAGARASADPSALAASLQLDNSIQQDGQEFFKLLLSLLESKLRCSAKEDVRSLVPKLFRGACAYETTCQVCQQLSESSQRETFYYELDVPVAGYATLEESLASMQGQELLCGANQYFCGHCNAKADATRQLRIRSLPPYMCLSLQRFVFDLKKLAKVKVSDKMSFPLRLDLRHHTRGSGSGEYQLAAILIHKGSSASHGHYVAHVRREGGDGGWWRCNDESVTPLPNGPMSSPQDLGVAAEKKATAEKKGAAKGSGRKGTRGMKRLVDVTDVHATVVSSKRAEVPSVDEDRVLSSNAYMLLYRRTSLPTELAEDNSDIPLPASLAEEVAAANNSFLQCCQAYQTELANVERRIEARRAAVRETLEASVMRSGNQPFRFVGATWLRTWADSVEEMPTDTTPLLCSHGKLHPEKLKDVKKVSLEAWRTMAAAEGGKGPELGPEDVCRECARQESESRRNQEASLQQRAAVLAQAEEDERCHPPPSAAFYVSKTWLSGWKKRSKQGASATSPTEGITCPHGSLLPEAAGFKAKRAVVSQTVWEFIRASWQSESASRAKNEAAAKQGEAAPIEDIVILEDGWEPLPAHLLHSNGADVAEPAANRAIASSREEQGRRLSEFPVARSAECMQCARALAEGAAAGRDLREQLEQQRGAVPMLLAGAGGRLEVGEPLCLLPRSWLQRWRAFVGGGSKRESGAAPHPGSLPEALEGLACTCHRTSRPGLAYPPPSVTKRRGRWAAEPDSVYEIAPLQEGLVLLEQYAPEHELGDNLPFSPEAEHPRLIKAELEIVVPLEPPASAAVINLEEQPAMLSEEEKEDEEVVLPSARRLGGQASLRTSPPVCRQAVVAREAAELTARLQYQDAEFVIELVDKTSLQEPPSERKSKRSRRGRTAVRLSCDTTLEGLRMVVAQELGVHPLNVAVHANCEGAWQLLQGDDTATLKDLRVLPDSELRVVNTGKHDDSDVASFVNVSDGMGRATERGFAGTVLTGQAPGAQ